MHHLLHWKLPYNRFALSVLPLLMILRDLICSTNHYRIYKEILRRLSGEVANRLPAL